MIRKKVKSMMVVAGVVILLIIIQTTPVFLVAPLRIKTIDGEFVRVHYQDADAQGAHDVFDLLEDECASLRALMKIDKMAVTDVYIYHTQRQLAIRKAGLITIAIAPKWYIGDSRNGNVMLVSPHAPIKMHTRESILQAAIHEYVHALVHQINPELSYFWDNGLATYLAKQKPDEYEFLQMQAPTLADMHTENELKFGKMGGYSFSYKYIEYLEKTYGWDKVLEFASGKESYESVFGKSEQILYEEWCHAINKYRS